MSDNRLEAIELRRVQLPLVTPFRLSIGVQTHRDALVVRAITSTGEGWGECVALATPVYSSEYVAGAQAVIADHLAPALLAEPHLTAARVSALLGRFHGHRMAKAALEMAVLDAELSAAKLPFSSAMGAVRSTVPSGVSVGILDSERDLLDAVEDHLNSGYLRIKLKIEPGWDLTPVAAVRRAFGPDVLLQVDANCAYSPTDVPHLLGLDEHGLLLIEQPFAEDDLLSHTRLQQQMRTPVCLDESVCDAASAAAAIDMGACRIVNIKPGRVGGYLESRRVAAVCASRSVPVWCGGMLETGLGRAANLALAAGAEFTLPSDISATDRYFATDITERFVLNNGHITVPTGPGLGVRIDRDALTELTTQVTLVGKDAA